MSIHPAITKKAEKMGLIGREPNPVAEPNFPVGTVEFHWAKHNVRAYGVGAKAAMEQAEALIALKDKYECHIQNDTDDPFRVKIWNDDRSLIMDRDAMLPTEALAWDKEWLPTAVPTDGKAAYEAGFTAADNPHGDQGDEDLEDAQREAAAIWDDEFDAAADAAENEEEPEPSGSVVKQEYRIRYAEAGHPNHCGDWLAETLNNLILGKTHTDIENFEALCNLNGVSLAKYKREGNGWQGRLRMTGRNLLVKPITKAGFLLIPAQLQSLTGGADRLPVNVDWAIERAPKSAAAEPPIDLPVTEDSAPGELPPVNEQMARIRKSKGKK